MSGTKRKVLVRLSFDNVSRGSGTCRCGHHLILRALEKMRKPLPQRGSVIEIVETPRSA